VLCNSCPLWKASDRVRAKALSSSTAVECVRVQLNECVDRRSSCELVGLCRGAMLARSSAATSMFFAHSVRWAVCAALVVLMVACGNLACRASRLWLGLWLSAPWLETQSRSLAAGWYRMFVCADVYSILKFFLALNSVSILFRSLIRSWCLIFPFCLQVISSISFSFHSIRAVSAAFHSGPWACSAMS
jgi:hypothetical protein